MLSIEQANIDRFTLLLETETEPTKRAMILRLLAEECAKLEALRKAHTEDGDLGTDLGA